ncbi:Hypothetical predicted protein [Pelobates cultripes]|uniref:Uncharacterized protein n=1 Tax=Pelobates cultripes TaxID=61616 RepID=A0AAD1VPR4_PELCU|nr:Hypothetical predicted protein [Pelobates cultripes]
MASGTKPARKKKRDSRDTHLSVADLFAAMCMMQASQDGRHLSLRGSISPTSNLDSDTPDIPVSEGSHILTKLMEHLRDHEVAYRWGPSLKLTVLHDGRRIQLQQQMDAGLPTPQTLQTSTPDANPQPSTQTWNVRNVRPFYLKARPTAVEPNLTGT